MGGWAVLLSVFLFCWQRRRHSQWRSIRTVEPTDDEDEMTSMAGAIEHRLVPYSSESRLVPYSTESRLVPYDAEAGVETRGAQPQAADGVMSKTKGGRMEMMALFGSGSSYRF